uniref:Uncharacterized protein n=1 Tax=Chromera velia CCMP2878 TaxID=1169474 RepID=A0A0G4GH50_9ALVE|eukprot:Cvel_21865.t1-p1 / transcript=Cvel_21865.t1 / gene=Cvel_21865 / organism=Chromera_velia_CCMP2878 / gene_product=hypothetical protein / transcript_product=hypothetical protein / location=Cvel_scaffold2090:10661-11593(+) / protein_length=311 / sequence_SO=supercontig / SO=protein_coding / is_pseudo=false
MDDEIPRPGIRADLTTRDEYLATRFEKLSASGYDLTGWTVEERREALESLGPLTELEEGVLVRGEMEPAGSGAFIGLRERGLYTCRLDGLPLFSSGCKYALPDGGLRGGSGNSESPPSGIVLPLPSLPDALEGGEFDGTGGNFAMARSVRSVLRSAVEGFPCFSEPVDPEHLVETSVENCINTSSRSLLYSRDGVQRNLVRLSSKRSGTFLGYAWSIPFCFNDLNVGSVEVTASEPGSRFVQLDTKTTGDSGRDLSCGKVGGQGSEMIRVYQICSAALHFYPLGTPLPVEAQPENLWGSEGQYRAWRLKLQ